MYPAASFSNKFGPYVFFSPHESAELSEQHCFVLIYDFEDVAVNLFYRFNDCLRYLIQVARVGYFRGIFHDHQFYHLIYRLELFGNVGVFFSQDVVTLRFVVEDSVVRNLPIHSCLLGRDEGSCNFGQFFLEQFWRFLQNFIIGHGQVFNDEIDSGVDRNSQCGCQILIKAHRYLCVLVIVVDLLLANF